MDEEFCRRCGRPFDEESLHYVEVELDDAAEYIFDQPLKEGSVMDRNDIERLVMLFIEYTELLQS